MFNEKYVRKWNKMKQVEMSEYKPYEERSFAMVDSTGMTMYLINEVDRPNVGCTLDFCHMLMKHDSPSYGLALAARQERVLSAKCLNWEKSKLSVIKKWRFWYRVATIWLRDNKKKHRLFIDGVWDFYDLIRHLVLLSDLSNIFQQLDYRQIQ